MSVRRFEDLAELLDAVDLMSVDFIELRADRVAAREVEPGVVQLGVAHELTTDAVVISFQCTLRHEAADIVAAVQCRYAFTAERQGTVNAPDSGSAAAELGSAAVELDRAAAEVGGAAAELDVRAGVAEIAPDVLRDFVEKVAVMAAYPFLRQGIHTLGTMLGLSGVTLGLLRAGSFSLEADGQPAATRARAAQFRCLNSPVPAPRSSITPPATQFSASQFDVCSRFRRS